MGNFIPQNFIPLCSCLSCFPLCGLVLHYPIDNEVFDEENYGIEYGTMTIIYCYFGDEMTLDGHHSNLRRACAGVMNMVRISIGATKIAALMVPRLKGKLKGITFFGTIPNEFILYFVVSTAKKTYKDTMKAALKTSVEGPLTNLSPTLRRYSCPLTSRALMPPPPPRKRCPSLWVATWSRSS